MLKVELSLWWRPESEQNPRRWTFYLYIPHEHLYTRASTRQTKHSKNGNNKEIEVLAFVTPWHLAKVCWRIGVCVCVCAPLYQWFYCCCFCFRVYCDLLSPHFDSIRSFTRPMKVKNNTKKKIFCHQISRTQALCWEENSKHAQFFF